MGAVEIAASLAASRRAVRLYPPEHPTHREAVAALCQTVNESIDIRPLVLNLREGRLYEGSEVLTDTSPATRALAEAMEARRVESLTFHTGFTNVDAEGISSVLGLRPSPDLHVGEELEAAGVRAVTVSELEDHSSKQAEERDRQREADRAVFRRLVAALDNIRTALASGTPTDTTEAARSIVQFVERVEQDPHAMLAIALMAGHGERWRFHATGVAVTSLVLGHEMGLSDRQLLDLGIAAALHDIGSLLSSEADPSAVEAAHPEVGARALARLTDEDCIAILVAYEHHMGVDGSGWPQRHADYAIHPFARIVAVADRYDNLVRPPEGVGLRPDEAISKLLHEASGGPLDPLITRLFARLIGVLPVGCVVRLSNHSVGVVCSARDDQLRPHLRMVLGADGTELHPVVDLDLRESELEIVEVLPARLLGLQPSDYL